MYAVYMKNSMQNRTYIAMFKINYTYIYICIRGTSSKSLYVSFWVHCSELSIYI